MNWLLAIAGIVSVLTTFGHFFVGRPRFLTPMLASEFDRIPKKMMHCVFHFISVFLITSTAILLWVGFGTRLDSGSVLLVRFISANFMGFALWQVGLAVASGIPNGVFKLFQWIFFVTISICSFLGTLK